MAFPHSGVSNCYRDAERVCLKRRRFSFWTVFGVVQVRTQSYNFQTLSGCKRFIRMLAVYLAEQIINSWDRKLAWVFYRRRTISELDAGLTIMRLYAA